MKNLYFETLNKLRLNNINNAELDLRIIINNSLIKKKESLIQDIKLRDINLRKFKAVSKQCLNDPSINSESSVFAPGLPAKCPQIDSIGLNSALGIRETSYSLSSGGKYRSVRQGITMVLAEISANAASKSPLYLSLLLISACCHVHSIASKSLASE